MLTPPSNGSEPAQARINPELIVLPMIPLHGELERRKIWLSLSFGVPDALPLSHPSMEELGEGHATNEHNKMDDMSAQLRSKRTRTFRRCLVPNQRRRHQFFLRGQGLRVLWSRCQF